MKSPQEALQTIGHSIAMDIQKLKSEDEDATFVTSEYVMMRLKKRTGTQSTASSHRRGEAESPEQKKIEKAKEKAKHSHKGRTLYAKRKIEIESVFGYVKQNLGFRRLHLRGIKKVTIELGLVALAHNIRK